MTANDSPVDHNIEVNGLKLHYVDWGGNSNRNLLLAHGQGGNARNWDHVARESLAVMVRSCYTWFTVAPVVDRFGAVIYLSTYWSACLRHKPRLFTSLPTTLFRSSRELRVLDKDSNFFIRVAALVLKV